MTTVVATPGQGPDRPQEVSYTDIKVSQGAGPKLFRLRRGLLFIPDWIPTQGNPSGQKYSVGRDCVSPRRRVVGSN